MDPSIHHTPAEPAGGVTDPRHVSMPIEAFRQVVGYLPVGIGPVGTFRPLDHLCDEEPLGRTEDGVVYRAKWGPPDGLWYCVVAIAGMEQVNCFFRNPNPPSMLQAFKVEMELWINRLVQTN